MFKKASIFLLLFLFSGCGLGSAPAHESDEAMLELAYDGPAQLCGLSEQALRAFAEDSSGRYNVSSVLDAISQKKADGWELSQLCFDRDIWVVGERDEVISIYFSMHQATSADGMSILGIFSFNSADDQVHISEPFKTLAGTPLTILDLLKDYNPQVLATLRARAGLVSDTGTQVEAYQYGPDFNSVLKSSSCNYTTEATSCLIH